MAGVRTSCNTASIHSQLPEVTRTYHSPSPGAGAGVRSPAAGLQIVVLHSSLQIVLNMLLNDGRSSSLQAWQAAMIKKCEIIDMNDMIHRLLCLEHCIVDHKSMISWDGWVRVLVFLSLLPPGSTPPVYCSWSICHAHSNPGPSWLPVPVYKLELQTKLREVWSFTITENGPTKGSHGWKLIIALSNLLHH